MSLFIGTDESGDKILHISSGSNSEAELKSGVLSSSIFYSKEKLVTIKKFNHIKLSGSTSDMYVEFSAEAIDYLHSKSPRLIFQVVVNGRVHDYLKWANNVDGMIFWYNALGGNYSTDPEQGYRFIRIGNSTTITSVELLVFNIDVEGNTYHPLPSSNEILINSSTFSIGGVNLGSINYACSPSVNSTDYSYLDSNENQVQILNTVPASLGVKVDMQSPLAVYFGTKKVLDASTNFITLHNGVRQVVHKALGSIVLYGGTTTNVQFFTIPSGVNKLIFSMYFPSSKVDHSFIVDGSDVRKEFARYYVGASVFKLYFYISDRIVYLRSEASGKSADTLTFLEGYYYLLYK